MLIYSQTYLQLIDDFANCITSLCDNLDSTKFNAIEQEFKSGYSYTYNIPITAKATNGNATAPAWDPHSQITVKRLDRQYKDNIARLNVGIQSNYIVQSTRNIKSDLTQYVQRYSIFNTNEKLSKKVTSNYFFSFINIVLSFCRNSLYYVVSPFSDKYYIEYQYSTETDTVVIDGIDHNDLIMVNSTNTLRTYIIQKIKNYTKYKMVKYTFSISRSNS